MRRLVVTAAAAVVAVASLVVWQAGGDPSDTSRSEAGSVAGLEEQSVKAGEVTVKLEPRRIDRDAAVFKVVLDTHSVELDQDLARSARLEVDGVEWPGAAWDGDGPSGHHREGELRFPAAGVPAGTARLTLSGFSTPVEATWTLAGD